MGHNASKVLLGAVASSKRKVTCEPADPATFVAGLIVHRKSDGGLELSDDNSTGIAGVSLGPDLSDAKKTAVCRKGLGVPVRVKSYFAASDLTVDDYTDADGDTLTVAGIDFIGQTDAVVEGDGTFRAATSEAATAASIAAQVNAHPDLAGIVTAEADGDEVTVTAVEPGTVGNSIDIIYQEDSGDPGCSLSTSGALEDGADVAVYGKVVYKNDEGLACLSTDGDAVATGGTYASGLLSGVDAAGDFVAYAALVDMVGGL